MSDLLIQSRKKSLRDAARAIRSSLSPEEIEEKSQTICSAVMGVLDDTDPVLVYVSKPLEVSTRMLIDQLLRRQKRVVVPLIEKETKTLRLSYINDASVLVPSTFHVHEPVGTEISAQPRDVKVVIVPMIAFDRHGNRLGYGAGYYDRFLSANVHITRIGLAFSSLEVTEVPSDANDIRMDVIITEKGIIRCGNEKERLNTIK